MQLILEGDSFAEIQRKVLALAEEFGTESDPAAAVAGQEEVAPTPIKRGPGRPKKETTPIAVKQEASPVVAPPAPAAGADAPPPPDPDAAVRTALTDLTTAAPGEEGLKLVREVLGKFGVKRISDLKPFQYPDVAKAASDRLAEIKASPPANPDPLA